MFAVIRTGGKQYKIQEGDILEVEKLNEKDGQKMVFDQVLLIEADGKTLIGTPLVENAVVKAEILENLKDEKVLVFKKKKRKQYRRTKGHRQELTRVKIQEIVFAGQPTAAPVPSAAKKTAVKPAAKPSTPPPSPEKKALPKPKKAPAAAKKSAPKPKPEKSMAPKKTSAAKPKPKPKPKPKTAKAKDKKE